MDFDRFIQGEVDELEDPAKRWKRHLKDPSCVVGEHKHCCPLDNEATLPPPLPPSLFGDVEKVRLLP
ncbi:unnamed protein product [Lupinus luteus]|uniref:Uncharacterized protein n=1 Tax=Lupinus luteus TaxID=3873 RepID=A0AAV1XSE9_LUPLU